MLTIRCSKCRKKLFKYEKIGKGKVLRCFKDRISHVQNLQSNNHLQCICGEMIGTDKGDCYQMIQGNFHYSGKKENG